MATWNNARRWTVGVRNQSAQQRKQPDAAVGDLTRIRLLLNALAHIPDDGVQLGMRVRKDGPLSRSRQPSIVAHASASSWGAKTKVQ
jgi:hypothetical protein